MILKENIKIILPMTTFGFKISRVQQSTPRRKTPEGLGGVKKC